MAEKRAFGTNYATSYQFPQIYFSGLSHHVLILKKRILEVLKPFLLGVLKRIIACGTFVDIAAKSC